MSKVLVFTQPRKVDFDTVEDRPLDGKEVRALTPVGAASNSH